VEINGRFYERAMVNDVEREFTGTISGTIEGRNLRFTKTYNEVAGAPVRYVGTFEGEDDRISGVWLHFEAGTGQWSMSRDGS